MVTLKDRGNRSAQQNVNQTWRVFCYLQYPGARFIGTSDVLKTTAKNVNIK